MRVEPCFAGPGLAVWWLPLPTKGAPRPADAELLSRHELERMSRFRDERDAARYAAVHAGARRLVALSLGVELSKVELGRRACPVCASSQHGPPCIAKPETTAGLSLSRSGPHGVVAISEQGPVGVDIEEVRPFPSLAATANRYMSSRELLFFERARPDDRLCAFFRCWTRKEAVAKAWGVGMAVDFAQLDADVAKDGHNDPVLVNSAATLATAAPPAPGETAVAAAASSGEMATTTRCHAYDFSPRPGLAGAVAVPLLGSLTWPAGQLASEAPAGTT